MRASTFRGALLLAAPLLASPAQADEAAPLLVTCAPAPTVNLPTAFVLEPGAGREGHPLVCGNGKVPRPIGRFGVKGLPRIGLKDVPGVETAAQAGLFYFYNAAFQTGTAITSSAKFAQYQPSVGVQDYHSLVEMAGQSPDGSNIIEIGWTVDPSLNHDDLPHLFVFHWINSTPTCYNACGYVQVSQTRFPGMPVTLTKTPQQYAFKFDGTNWWVGYQGEWIGYFPGSLWSGQFTQLGFTQWFGEVAASSEQPCSQMGNGAFGSGNGAAIVTAEKFGGASAAIQGELTDPEFYAIGAFSKKSFHLGGPGAC